jgi:hypothetical protein
VEVRAKSGKTSVIVLSGNGLTVELIRHDDAMDLGKDALLTHGLFKAGVVVENLDKTLAELKDRNVPFAYGSYPARAMRWPISSSKTMPATLFSSLANECVAAWPSTRSPVHYRQ